MTDIEIERARQREKYHRLYKNTPRITYGENGLKWLRNYRAKYPEKYAAGKAIRNWKRKNGMCFHHWSYRKEHYKDIVVLAADQHYKAHRYLIYDQERMMYRTVENVLLDTKESHIKYIKRKIRYAK